MSIEPTEAAVVRLMLAELEHAVEQHEQEVRDCHYEASLIKAKTVRTESEKRTQGCYERIGADAAHLADRARVRANALLACLKAAGWALDDLDVTAAG